MILVNLPQRAIVEGVVSDAVDRAVHGEPRERTDCSSGSCGRITASAWL
jgi:hypothetical protein